MPTQAAEIPLRAKVKILGIDVDRISMADTVDLLESYLKGDVMHLVLTADASAVFMAANNPDVRSVFESADLVTADGAGVVWAANHLGAPVPERVSGVDLVERLFELSARGGYRIYCLGAADGVALNASQTLQTRFPGANVVGTHHGFYAADTELQIVEEIAATKPDILLVAMGIPRQEQFVIRNRERLNVKVAMGVGGSFDVFSGKVRRAPTFMRRLHVEWLWRLMQDPSKARRIAMLPKFMRDVRKQAKNENLHKDRR